MQFTDQLKSFDKFDYLAVLNKFDRHLIEAKNNFLRQSDMLQAAFQNLPNNLIICGMGGSAIAGDFIKNLYQDHINIPIHVIRDYSLPKFVDSSSMVILSSYSGNTEETLSAFEDALSRQAKMVCLTTGGELARLALGNKRVLFTLPSGLQPRQALPFSLILLIGLVETLVDKSVNWNPVDESIKLSSQLRVDYAPDGKACLLDAACALSEKPVAIYCSETLFPAAVRLKGQLNENAKLLASAAPVPEMNHNEIVGWEGSVSSCNVILLRDSGDHPRVSARLDILGELLAKRTKVHTVYTQGVSLLSRYMSLICWSDWISYYAALVKKTDPTPVEIITYLKNELAKIPQK